IMISGHGTIYMAVTAMELGALDFIEKPLSVDRMLIRLTHALDKKKLQDEYMLLKREADERYQMIGESQVMQELVAKIRQVAPTNSRVLITGENGTGKELAARAIHRNSERKDKPFIQMNYAAIPQDLIESELFGHEKGAFTGAIKRTQGKFEQADGGTILLDEIGDMSLLTQAKVLRVLESGEFTRVGGGELINVDVRVIAATNKELDTEVKEGRFREDLFYRLNVIPINIPALRERTDDIPILADYFMNTFCRENGKRIKKIEPEAMKILQSYSWPGNVRELKNLVERLVIMAPSDTIKPSDLPSSLTGDESISPDISSMTLKDARNEFERKFILDALDKHDWNVTETASQLGIERTNLYRKMRQHDIERS
ncbi:AAA domain-containing protein, partial [Candidatus Poribacteria bacterium]|nr:AAA domain-containing protein [Candidatus Poribacteria bacterium]